MTAPTGMLQGKFRKSPIESQKRLLMWIAIWLAVCLLGRVGGRTAIDNPLGLILMVAGIAIGTVGVLFDLPRAFLREETFELYSDGFVLQTLQGKQAHIWDEVQEYTYNIWRRMRIDPYISTPGEIGATIPVIGSPSLAEGVFPAVEYRLVLRTSDQATIILNNYFQGISVLANALNIALRDPLYIKCVEQLGTTKQIKFGEFIVRNEGLQYKNRSVAWKEVAGIAIESIGGKQYDGIVVRTYQSQGLLKGNIFVKEKIGNVPNAFALLEIGNQLIKVPKFLRGLH